MTPPPQSDERAIVIRDRRKPNQFTTDNVIAREWLPILRVGDAFFFYAVYLSMANRETESSWGSLRTMARYLQCGVDLIIRGNRLLEICELIHIETGNQHTSNEYYVLDPPALTPELSQRIQQRLEETAAQETGKNWQSWVRQVRKALKAHRSLPSIWEEKRANRGGRPVRTVRAQNSARESQPGFLEKGACETQPGSMCLTTREHVSHEQPDCETHAEQEKQTTRTEQAEGKQDLDPGLLLVKTRCQCLGLTDSTIAALLESHPLSQLTQQLEWLPSRYPRDPAAMFVSAVQGDWSAPTRHDADLAQAVWEEWMASTVRQEMSPKDPPPGEPISLVFPDSDQDARDVWARVLVELQTQMTRVAFDTWLVGAQVLSVSSGTLIVGVRDEVTAEWLRTRWLTSIERAVAALVGRPVPVCFEVCP